MAGTLHIGTFEAKNKLSSLVDRASKGSRIWITKRGKRAALLSSGVECLSKPEMDPIASFQRIRSRSKRGKDSMKYLIEEGRR
ncbi:MAG: type II toxin-antitoxin system Phd/YefM family antitoxin [Chthoniobacterales bacterium]